MAAALLPGAAVFANPPQRLEMCGGVPALPTREQLNQTDIVVIGTVVAIHDTGATLAPEAFLKGPARAGDITIDGPVQVGCPRVALHVGDRVLLSLYTSGGRLTWPLMDSPGEYVLQNGKATSLYALAQATPVTTTETAVVDHIRSITGQYAVPARSNSQGASLDWLKVVLPVTIVVLLVFGIGLYLMKIWHRIDPT